MTDKENKIPIDYQDIENILADGEEKGESKVREVLRKALELKGLDKHDVHTLMNVKRQSMLEEVFHTAKRVKEEIYGKRVVIFAPLYISNFCCNDCLYCAFRSSNQDIVRRALSQDEISCEVKTLINQGHKRILLVTGEAYPHEGFQYVLNAIETIYNTKIKNGEIRRVNVNIAPLTLEEFKELKAAKIGTYQIFQETYHRKTYSEVHVKGKKSNFEWRITAPDRAMEAGIDDVGIGVLFGLYDWKYEVLALMQHIKHLETNFGVGPHTLSVPRLEPAEGSRIASNPPYAVTDRDFLKLVAILRLAVPYTGIIMSTRENPEIRRETFELGVSQISAGSRTNPGGYSGEPFKEAAAQFQLGDHRPLDDVIRDIASLGFIPSFCTACYRLGRTGGDFMDLAKPGEIKHHCDPNALSTFLEYLIDYGSPATNEVGKKLIETSLSGMTENTKKVAEGLMEKVRSGKRDIYC